VKAGFFPDLPLPLSEMVLFGIILLTGALGSRLTARSRFLPKVSGYLAIGFLLGPSMLNWLNEALISQTQFLVEIATGIILFELGRRLDLGWLRHDRGLLATALTECAASFVAVYVALILCGLDPLLSALAAAIGISTSPAVFLMVARELGAEGQVTRRAANLVAFNNGVALVVFTILLSLVHVNFNAGVTKILLHPTYLLLGSVALGAAAFLVMLLVARFTGKQEGTQFIVLVGAILVAVGLARSLNLSVLLALLALGVCARNLDRSHHLLPVELGYASEIFMVLLFVVAGAQLQFNRFPEIAVAASAFVLVRACAKVLPVVTLCRLNHLTFSQSSMLGLLLVPLAAIALSMSQTVSSYYPALAHDLGALMITSVTFLEIVGPILTHYAFRKAGEANPVPV
jgi:Kef-type K+ transport system membrane component KefB